MTMTRMLALALLTTLSACGADAPTDMADASQGYEEAAEEAWHADWEAKANRPYEIRIIVEGAEWDRTQATNPAETVEFRLTAQCMRVDESRTEIDIPGGVLVANPFNDTDTLSRSGNYREMQTVTLRPETCQLGGSEAILVMAELRAWNGEVFAQTGPWDKGGNRVQINKNGHPTRDDIFVLQPPGPVTIQSRVLGQYTVTYRAEANWRDEE
ncbi:MAG: hypothetical protein AAF311_13205 [Pseudomonadota bacterium]